MSAPVRVYFGSNSNMTHFAMDWSERQSSRVRSVEIHEDYVQLTVYNTEEREELDDLAAQYGGEVTTHFVESQ